MKDAHDQTNVEQLLATPGLADALESEQFKQFLDHVPVAIAVSEIQRAEAITYCNLEFERLTGRTAADIQGHDWTVLSGEALAPGEKASLSEAVMSEDEYIGTFKIANGETICDVDAWSNIIENDHGTPLFRLVALATTGQRIRATGEQDEQLLRDKDVLLRELQHRVKNNLQMITALIRMEARNLPDGETGERFTRLAGRINSLALLYDLLAGETMTDGIDLGVYLSKIASSVMEAHAIQGIRLELRVDAWPVSINVAMPTGLVVNELMTNALKHGFVGRDRGTITMSSLVDETGCRIVVADDGVGFAEGVTWPTSGKLGSVIVQSLKQNARAVVDVQSSPGNGTRISIFFARKAAEPASNPV